MNVNDNIWVRHTCGDEHWQKTTIKKLMDTYGSHVIVDGEIRTTEPEECRDPLVRFREYLVNRSISGGHCDKEYCGAMKDALDKFDSLVLGDKS